MFKYSNLCCHELKKTSPNKHNQIQRPPLLKMDKYQEDQKHLDSPYVHLHSINMQGTLTNLLFMHTYLK